MNHYRITVIYNGETIQVYPSEREKRDTSFEDVCKRIGMMAMSSEIVEITVYRDEQEYRHCIVQARQEVKSVSGT
jgi:hypothetical protein